MVTIRRASLAIHGGPHDRMTVLLAGQPIHLGRRPDSDIVIDDATVSRRHAVIDQTPFGFALRDLSSANGTYVSGGRVGRAGHLLRHGDTIHLAGCDVTLVFLQEALSTVIIEEDSPPSWPHDWVVKASA
jgi:pSer/pThr/pTyr-binding forkhead associated (FHA) protein